jgi:hypothetical protein
LEKLQNAQVDRRKSEKEICGVFLQSRNRKSHENERKIVPKVIIPEPPGEAATRNVRSDCRHEINMSNVCHNTLDVNGKAVEVVD